MVLKMKPLLVWRMWGICLALVLGFFILLAFADPAHLGVALGLSAFVAVIMGPISAYAVSRRLVYKDGIISDKTFIVAAWKSPAAELALYPEAVTLITLGGLRWTLPVYGAYDRTSDKRLGYFATGVFDARQLSAFLKASGYAPRGEQEVRFWE